ncbi:MAG: hypothetical protein JW920_11170 [Deltaproteobacteria bacterium]|nr:hypothetical protein [Deltaproteobacteria bacterium]
MIWSKEMPKKPGFYWLLKYDEKGKPITSVTEFKKMPESAQEIVELMDLENLEAAEDYKGQLLLFCTGDACAHVADDPEFANLHWYGPLEAPEEPV